jgi:glutamate-ammonia-ligase adenylyltransferase
MTLSDQVDTQQVPAELRPELVAAVARFDQAHESASLAPPITRQLPRVWTCSRFVADGCVREPSVLEWLAAPGLLDRELDAAALQAEVERPLAVAADDAAWLDALRIFRRRHLIRIAWRDLAGLAGIDAALREASALADVCVRAAYARADAELAARHGAPLDARGEPLKMLILGMGKLGGVELNFSSDIDLVMLFPEHGETSGRRALTFEEYFARIGRRVAQLLATTTAQGFVYRVDLRLRPFGESGPLVVSFEAFEDYLQQHGRDWERYAYVKARPLVGETRYPTLYRNVLRPFVYRRYLDFGVFESLRDMKELIAREVERRDLEHNIKLGPGGIREIEFIVQAFQLIRGGSDARLQTRGLLDALRQLAGQKLLPGEAVARLEESYRYLRRVENRLQIWNDEQTHELPETDIGRARLAFAMDAPDWPTLVSELETHRARVAAQFHSLMFTTAAGTDETPTDLERLLEPELDQAARRDLLVAAGIRAVDDVFVQLELLRDSSYLRRLDTVGRRRLQTLLPRVLKLVAGHAHEGDALRRVLQVVERIGGRTVYLALLNENANALKRLVELCAHSQFLSDQIAAFPLLLDELIDARVVQQVPTRAEFEADLGARIAGADIGDPEQQVEVLRQFQRAAVFRVAVPDLRGRLPLMKVSDRLTDIAELIVQQALDLSWSQIVARHGAPLYGGPDTTLERAGVAVIAYGKFGGIELGYGSDLDLVFVHDSVGDTQQTAGPVVVESSVFFLRLVQRVVHVLTMHSAAGRLYEVDTRLRPSGKGGLLVQSIDSFRDYQRREAWTWEHQALLRARPVAGPPALRERFAAMRIEALRTYVHHETLREDVRSMRERMRHELSAAKPGQFDLKQDRGGLTDIEFLAQYWALHWAVKHAEVVTYTDIIRQLESLASADLVPQSTVDVLTGAYRTYRQRIHHLSLDRAPGVVASTEFSAERDAVTAIWREIMEAGAKPG